MNTAEHTQSRRSGGVGAKLALIAAGILSIALLIFVLQNTVHTTINFLGWNADVAQGVSLLIAAVVGGVIALVVSAAIRLRKTVS
ncbi:DUF1049 domain-containing protein [Mycolicibacterium chubuense]|uniref:Lipopolysaccharide assembly protein A domain-containing protein n=1 Tax=Mycolicibacterium chubuense TaxID=1800 RepID=A0A0J6VQH0_MYCCU|nr:lipopolysaccharide assembly protein LapA domain-containing protein [Mycolicibacterium chubuense]KMO73305.1 hypothetical protein MCHUDSM44219_04483 [Mycolicibacterium chubuense]ORA56700.1 DUF1049 domain-containing protein [Mycolicibacterium chubuense]SPX98840.1 uncharacterized integral membrane protein [Mycolicibacterium chubuense]